jgi:hypothetical protein
MVEKGITHKDGIRKHYEHVAYLNPPVELLL